MTAPTSTDLVARAIRLSEARLARWAPQVLAAPPTACRRHPGRTLPADLDRSSWASDQAAELTICWEPCPDCAMERVHQELRRRLIERGVPARSVDITLASWDPAWEPTAAASRTEALAQVTDWCQLRPSPFLLILGAAGGTGKTALGVAALRHFGRDIRCIEYRDFIERLSSTSFEDRQPLLESVRAYPALMIDDFGNRHVGTRDVDGGNAFERDAMATILNHRFERGLPTIITSNLTRDQLAGRLDDRTVDRIAAGRLLIDASAWPSKRRTQI